MITKKTPKKTVRRKSGNDEHKEQAALFRWADLQRARWPELRLMYAIPNGGRRDVVTGAMLKAEGVKAGVPDLCLPVARTKYHGLYIELKTKTGKPSKQQLRWLESLSSQGYLTAICHGWLPASRLIASYLAGNNKVENERLHAKPQPVTRRRNHRPGQHTGAPPARRRSRLRYAGKEDRVN